MSLPRWNYFLAIEEDLAKCARYVEFTEANMATYSIEFAQIILRARAETDVVGRAISGKDKEKWRRDLRNALNATAGLQAIILERLEMLGKTTKIENPSSPRLLGPLKTVDDGWSQASISWDWKVR